MFTDVGQRHVQTQARTVEIKVGIEFEEGVSEAVRGLETKLTGVDKRPQRGTRLHRDQLSLETLQSRISDPSCTRAGMIGIML